uniref:Reverse transcriptase domain-containing protein n=1 Tax=Tanacetum cinerariifolium TaxID=118510 RepID=A0A6L2NBT6_TANCI|nr:hypothetical protein [Tanacetum cinerariifolium]
MSLFSRCSWCGGPFNGGNCRHCTNAANIDQPPLQETSLKEMKDLKQHYLDEMLSLINDLRIKDYQNEKIDIRFRWEYEVTIHELKGKFNGTSIEINKRREHDDDDYDYEESVISLNETISQEPPSIANTYVLLTLEPEDSLIIRNEELSTIPKKESDEFIKSSVEDLIPIPSKFEDTFGSDSERILPSCDDFFPIDIPEEKSVTFSNPLFNSDDDFISSDDESLSDEDIPKDNVKIYSNPLFEFDYEYISSDVNPFNDEVLVDIKCKDSYDPKLDESTFTPDDDVEFLLHHDPSILKMSVASILEGFTDEPPLE